MRVRFALACPVLLALLFAWPGVAAVQLSPASQQTSPSFTAAAPLPGLFSPARGNLMFWKTHKVGGTTLRHVLLRRQAALNLTLGVLGCTRQREPSQAHLSASHVVCEQRTRCACPAVWRFLTLQSQSYSALLLSLFVSSRTPLLPTQGRRPRRAAGQELLGGASTSARVSFGSIPTSLAQGCVCEGPHRQSAVRLLLHHHVATQDRCSQCGELQPACTCGAMRNGSHLSDPPPIRWDVASTSPSRAATLTASACPTAWRLQRTATRCVPCPHRVS
jgi:hypothetical protein